MGRSFPQGHVNWPRHTISRDGVGVETRREYHPGGGCVTRGRQKEVRRPTIAAGLRLVRRELVAGAKA